MTSFYMHAKIAQSTELWLSQYVKQCVLVTLKRDDHELAFWTAHFLFLDSTLFRLDSAFWLDSIHA